MRKIAKFGVMRVRHRKFFRDHQDSFGGLIGTSRAFWARDFKDKAWAAIANSFGFLDSSAKTTRHVFVRCALHARGHEMKSLRPPFFLKHFVSGGDNG